MMRILSLADVPPNPNAGASGTEWHTNEALRRRGHEVDALWRDDLGMRIRHGNLRYLIELPARIEHAVRAAFRAKKYDVVQISQPHGYRVAEFSRNNGALFVHRSHGLEPRVAEELRRWHVDRRTAWRRAATAVLAKPLARHMTVTAKRADGHIVLCTDDARYLQERLAVPRERIAVVAPAPPPHFQRDPRPMTAARLRRVLYVSQFAPFKAPEIVAAVMRGLAETHELTWVCAQADHDAVRQLVGVPLQLHDWMPAAGLEHVYDAHGVFLFPSYVEGFGKVFLEAMSRGLCVVASDTSGARDAITHGRDGLLAPVGDAAAMLHHVRSLTMELAVSVSAAAAETASHYTWGRAAQETEAFYESLLR
jgi:glycosyltransferase involved in cell wall biosynthesis